MAPKKGIPVVSAADQPSKQLLAHTVEVIIPETLSRQRELEGNGVERAEAYGQAAREAYDEITRMDKALRLPGGG